jgi:gliding motility-associated-like protein
MKKKFVSITFSLLNYSLFILLCLLSVTNVDAQISMTASPTTYSQNFDGLSNNSPGTNVTWTDNVTIPGWFTNQTNYRTWSTGDAAPSNRIWACGSALGNTDRALGSIMTSTTLRVWAVKFTNNTGSTLPAFVIGFDAERFYTAGTGSTLQIQYSTTGAIDDATNSSAWTTVAGVTNPTNNLRYVLSGLNLVNGATVTIRFFSDYGGSSSNVSLWATDNFTAAWALPAVTTVSATQTGQTSATANGSITSTGASTTLLASGVCFSSTNTTPTLADSKTTDGILSTGNYTSNLTGLTAGTLYYVRAYATNDVGTSYGSVTTFTTAAATVPVLTTIAASNITPVSANVGGNITSDGGRPVTTRGVCWSTSTNPTIANSFVTSGADIGSFTSLLSVLAPSTTYFARAFATNNVGTAYGNNITFTTTAAAPTILVNPTSLAFGTVLQGNTSPEKTYTIGGYFLSPATGNLTITAPAGYKISLTSGTGFQTVITLPYSGGSLPTTTIYVRFSPNALANYNKNITNSGGGATTQLVNLTGAVEPVGGQGQQGFSNKGTDFWTGFGPHEKIGSADGTNNNALMTLYFTADVASTVTIYVGNNLVQTLNVPAGSVTASNQIPYSGTNDARLDNEGVYAGKGIYINSTNPVVAYAEIYGSQVTAATVLFPVNTLGKSYTALNYTQLSNSSASSSRSYVFVVATQNNTTVQAILPPGVTSETGLTGTNTKTLNRGDVWLIKANNNTTDITGTQIKSISSSGNSCQPIAVFSGSGKIAISCDGSTPSSDNLFQQCFPSVAWGRKYVSAPTAGTGYNNNIYRVMINPDYASTTVTVNGVTLPNTTPIPGITTASTTSPSTTINLTNGLYYEFRSTVPVVINSTSPVMVAQYITNASKCGNNYTGTGGDPDMIYLSSVEQTINKIIVSPIQTQNSNATNFINVVIKTADIPNFSIKDQNNANVPATFVAIDATYSYAQVSVANGYSSSVYYTLNCTSGGFNAISYGYASSESYAYNAGTNLVDLLSNFNVQNQFGSGSSPAACKGSQFYMSVTLSFKPVSISWNFANNPNLSPNTSVTQTSTDLVLPTVLVDSVQINGVWLYTYQIPTPYTYNAVGTFPVVVNAVSPTPDGCNGVKTFNFPVTVVQGPTSGFTFVNPTGCLVPIQFNSTAVGNGFSIDQWQWDFADPSSGVNNTASILNPIHSFTAGGTYPVKLRVITSEGCYADSIRNVALSAVPVANFTQTSPLCAGVAIPFNSTTSTIAPVGTINQWAWNFADPSSGANNIATTQNPSHIFASANTYNVSLTVTSSTGCSSTPRVIPVTISPNPTADFTFTSTGCAKDIVSFNGLPNGMTSYAWNFADPASGSNNTATTQSTTHLFTSANSYNVNLVVTSSAGCTNSVTKPLALVGTLSNPTVTLTNTGATSLTFSWTTVAGAVGYQVSTDGINFVTPSSGATGLTHTVSGLAANQSVTLTVKALGTIACQNTIGNATGLTLYPDVGIFIPNTFTPNGDGKNDVLKVYGNYLQKLNMRIFNQWGEKVFETNEVTGGWDGTYKGQQAAVGVYVYTVTATMPDGRVISKKGTINLIR